MEWFEYKCRYEEFTDQCQLAEASRIKCVWMLDQCTAEQLLTTGQMSVTE